MPVALNYLAINTTMPVLNMQGYDMWSTKELYYNRISNGLCGRCGNPAEPNRSRCKICLDRKKTESKTRYTKLINRGLCTICGIRPLAKPGAFACTECANRKNTIQTHLNNTARNHGYRRMVLEHYGLQCACCGNDNYSVLTIDHIDNDGAVHRKELGSARSSDLYRWIIRHDFPSGFQTLCFNCNVCKAKNNNICPHHGDHRSEPSSRKGKATRKQREYILRGYGGRCVRCGESNLQFLTIDHVNNNGTSHREHGYMQVSTDIVHRDFPSDYQLLCHNCNYVKYLESRDLI